MLLLPDISWADIYNYFINTPIAYTDEEVHTLKSLEVFQLFCMQACSRFFLLLYFKRVKLLLCQRKMKEKTHIFVI